MNNKKILIFQIPLGLIVLKKWKRFPIEKCFVDKLGQARKNSVSCFAAERWAWQARRAYKETFFEGSLSTRHASLLSRIFQQKLFILASLLI